MSGRAYSHRPGVLVQRDISIVEFDSVEAALSSPEFDLPDPRDTAMLVSNRGQMYELNFSGALVWESLDGKKTPGDLAKLVAETFDVEPVQAERDVQNLIADLERIGLVV
jgi:hypothetical protein